LDVFAINTVPGIAEVVSTSTSRDITDPERGSGVEDILEVADVSKPVAEGLKRLWVLP